MTVVAKQAYSRGRRMPASVQALFREPEGAGKILLVPTLLRLPGRKQLWASSCQLKARRL